MDKFKGNNNFYDLGITVDRICIGNYVCVATNDKFKEAIEIESIDKDFVVGKRSDGSISKFRYEDLRGIPMCDYVMREGALRYGGSVSSVGRLLKKRIALKPNKGFDIPFFDCYVGDEPFSAIRCVHEWQNLMKLTNGQSLVNEDFTTIINKK